MLLHTASSNENKQTEIETLTILVLHAQNNTGSCYMVLI